MQTTTKAGKYDKSPLREMMVIDSLTLSITVAQTANITFWNKTPSILCEFKQIFKYCHFHKAGLQFHFLHIFYLE